MARTTQGTITAPWFPGVFNPALSQFQTFQGAGPTLTDIYQNMPQLQVPGLDPGQQTALQELAAQTQNSPEQQQQMALIAQLAGGPLGSSPETKAGMEAFQQLEAPIIAQQSALRGTAGGGQAIEALGQGATQVLLPLLQAESARKEAAVGQLGTIGQQKVSNLALNLEAAGVPREVALEQAQALYQKQEQQSKFATGLQSLPLQFLGELGIAGTTSQPSNLGGNILSALGPAIAALIMA